MTPICNILWSVLLSVFAEFYTVMLGNLPMHVLTKSTIMHSLSVDTGYSGTTWSTVAFIYWKWDISGLCHPSLAYFSWETLVLCCNNKFLCRPFKLELFSDWLVAFMAISVSFKRVAYLPCEGLARQLSLAFILILLTAPTALLLFG